ncbi:MAG TPA: hypothetical protein PKD73_00945 [Burkholderiaceae bacterium]|nr:hypothetical protein [Burkholderiaceae bacterium]
MNVDLAVIVPFWPLARVRRAADGGADRRLTQGFSLDNKLSNRLEIDIFYNHNLTTD